MVAFITSILVAVIMTIPFWWYRAKRPLDAVLTWGEAMVAATWAFALMFWVYGVVPHQWLELADAQWNWRSDRELHGPGGFLKDQEGGGFVPFTTSYQAARDIIAVIIYGVFLGMHIAAWAIWQDRGDVKKKKEDKLALAKSDFGRPLVKKA
jgi:hypothetical protein